jgi:hypothetical protein
MLNMDEIHAEIEKLENCDCTTYHVCEKLAILYIVREYYSKKMVSAPAMRTTMTTPTAP